MKMLPAAARQADGVIQKHELYKTYTKFCKTVKKIPIQNKT